MRCLDAFSSLLSCSLLSFSFAFICHILSLSLSQDLLISVGGKEGGSRVDSVLLLSSSLDCISCHHRQVRASGPRVVVMFFFLSWSLLYWIYPERWPWVKAAGRRWKRNFGITEKNFRAKFRCGRGTLVVRKRGCSQTNSRSCVVVMMLAG